MRRMSTRRTANGSRKLRRRSWKNRKEKLQLNRKRLPEGLRVHQSILRQKIMRYLSERWMKLSPRMQRST